MKLSQQQKLILGILSIVVVFLFVIGLGLVYITYEPQLVLVDKKTATEVIPPLPTYTSPPSLAPISTFTFIPTATPLPNPLLTPFILNIPTKAVVPSLTPVTIVQSTSSNPNPLQNPPPQSPTQQIVKDCSPQLNYAKSVHEYNLANIDSRYEPLITFYENLLQQAIADRDALAVVRYQRELDSVKKQYNAAIKAENQRFESEIAYIKSTCK